MKYIVPLLCYKSHNKLQLLLHNKTMRFNDFKTGLCLDIICEPSWLTKNSSLHGDLKLEAVIKETEKFVINSMMTLKQYRAEPTFKTSQE